MQATNISNINYDNEDNAKIIEDALKETEVLDIENEPEQPPQQIMPQQNPPQQYQPYQNPPQQYQPSTQPSTFQQQYQQPQQYQQEPQQYYQQPHQKPQKQEEKKDFIPTNVLNNLKHSLILMILLFLLNNKVFKDIIGQLPFTMDEDGDANIFLTMVLCIIITFSYSVYLQFFN